MPEISFTKFIKLKVEKKLLTKLFQPYLADDSYFQSFCKQYQFDDYAINYLANGGFYFIEKETRDLIKNHYLEKGKIWEPNVYEQLKRFAIPKSTVIDVGGHMGTHTLPLSRFVGYEGVVHVFEPQAKLFSELLINMHINDCSNIHFYRKALGNKRQAAEMSPFNAANEGNAWIDSGGDKVQMEKLDDLNVTNVSLIKIDVEGYEDKVIEGAIKTITEQNPVLIVEIWNDAQFQQKIRKILNLGYQAFKLFDANNYLFIPTCSASNEKKSEFRTH